MSTQKPYPTAVEVIRALSNALDTKTGNKALDDKAADPFAGYGTIQAFLAELIPHSLADRLGDAVSDLLSGAARELVFDYLTQVGTVSLDGIPRANAIRALADGHFSQHGARVLTRVLAAIDGPQPISLVASSDRAVGVVVEWFEQHIDRWTDYLASCDKEQRDRIGVWRRGEELPSRSSIQRLAAEVQRFGGAQAGQTVCTLLLVARTIDHFRRDPLGQIGLDAIRMRLWSAPVQDFPAQVAALQAQCTPMFEGVIPLIARLTAGLLPTQPKAAEDQAALRHYLEAARKQLAAVERGQDLSYWLDWHEARWHVFAGDLKAAYALYQKAFAGALFMAGDNQKLIIEEALVVNSAQPSPNRVFLKKLKNAAICFGYDIPISTDPHQRPSAKSADVVEEWEIDMLRGHFGSLFPEHGLFQGVTLKAKTPRVGPLIVHQEMSRKPDLRHPDRQIKIGETWQKKMPQLVWFADMEDIPAVEQLLQAGADVNACSESGDTALLLAIETLNVTSLPYRSLDDTLFRLLSKYYHSQETVNRRTVKKRLLPLISAVETGRLEIVRWLLDRGAEPDRRGQTDEQTALNVCLKYIGFIKNPERFWRVQEDMPVNAAVLDGMRRYTRGLHGFTLTHQRQAIGRQAEYTRLFKRGAKQLMTERVLASMSLTELRAIAELLLERGADPNAEHTNPIPGYTPLMLAAELDEDALFGTMLAKGGNPNKSYWDPSTDEPLDCRAIAWEFGSRAVIERLYKL